MIYYIFSSWKMYKKNAILFKLFWYKIFVLWKLKLLNFLTDSVLILICETKIINLSYAMWGFSAILVSS